MYFLHSRLQKWIHLMRRRVCTLISKHTWCLHYTWNTSHQKFEYNKNDHERFPSYTFGHHAVPYDAAQFKTRSSYQTVNINTNKMINCYFVPFHIYPNCSVEHLKLGQGFNHSLVLYLFHCCIDESSLQMKRNKINLLPWDETSLTTAVLTDVRTCCRSQHYKMP